MAFDVDSVDHLTARKFYWIGHQLSQGISTV
jgi:hypothetical protein